MTPPSPETLRRQRLKAIERYERQREERYRKDDQIMARIATPTKPQEQEPEQEATP